jgi:hypothetical protein
MRPQRLRVERAVAVRQRMMRRHSEHETEFAERALLDAYSPGVVGIDADRQVRGPRQQRLPGARQHFLTQFQAGRWRASGVVALIEEGRDQIEQACAGT